MLMTETDLCIKEYAFSRTPIWTFEFDMNLYENGQWLPSSSLLNNINNNSYIISFEIFYDELCPKIYIYFFIILSWYSN